MTPDIQTGFLLYVINTLGVIVGFIGVFLLKNIFTRMREAEDKIAAHREDTLQFYVHRNHLAEMKKDILENLDRVEQNLKATLQNALQHNQNNHRNDRQG